MSGGSRRAGGSDSTTTTSIDHSSRNCSAIKDCPDRLVDIVLIPFRH